MAKGIFLLVAGLGVAAIAFSQRDEIADAMISRAAFVDCFQAEFVTAMQAEGLHSGNNLMALSADAMFGSQAETLGNVLMDRIDREGSMLLEEEQQERASRLTAERLAHYEATKELKGPEVDEVVAQTTVTCIRRGRPW